MTELVTNGGFDTDTIWTKGTGWTISGGQGIAAATAANQFISQTVSVIKNGVYVVSYDVANFSSGDVRPSFDSGDNGTARTANGSYSDTITLTAAATTLRFGRSTGDFTGRIDNVSLQGLSSTVDETALGIALSARLDGFASPEQRARAMIQAYVNGGVGARTSITLNETALGLATTILRNGIYPSPAARVRAAVEAYLGATASP